MDNELLVRCADLLYREAACLDQQRWSEWLALFTEDAEFWIPAWDAEHELTSDPHSQISLMYYNSRASLEDRVWRIQSGLSSASTPLPRTCHLITNIWINAVVGERVHVSANWLVQSFSVREQYSHAHYGFYEYVLRWEGRQLRIASKKIIVLNDVIPSALDIYSV
jgi:3-phenylpropionate/cinnamic acid dioxygenase small subunit